MQYKSTPKKKLYKTEWNKRKTNNYSPVRASLYCPVKIKNKNPTHVRRYYYSFFPFSSPLLKHSQSLFPIVLTSILDTACLNGYSETNPRLYASIRLQISCSTERESERTTDKNTLNNTTVMSIFVKPKSILSDDRGTKRANPHRAIIALYYIHTINHRIKIWFFSTLEARANTEVVLLRFAQRN